MPFLSNLIFMFISMSFREILLLNNTENCPFSIGKYIFILSSYLSVPCDINRSYNPLFVTTELLLNFHDSQLIASCSCFWWNTFHTQSTYILRKLCQSNLIKWNNNVTKCKILSLSFFISLFWMFSCLPSNLD